MEPPKETQKRQIAYKISIKDIFQGKYVQQEGWNPNYIESFDGKKISRVNIIGIVLSKEDNQETSYKSILIDDGSGTISAKSFGEDSGILQNIQIGDPVLIIGRIKEYNSELHILIEIIKKLEDPKWIEIRKIELEKNKINVIVV